MLIAITSIAVNVSFLICLCFNKHMNLPFINKNQDQYYYPEEGGDKKKMIIMFGGIIVVLLLGALLLFSGGDDQAGQLSMKQSLQSTNEALGIIDEYQSELTYSPTKNDVALIQIILRGNYLKLSDLYVEAYGTKKPSSSFKPDEASVEELDRSVRNNTINTDIITILEPKITEAEKSLQQASVDFTKQSSVELIKVSVEDFVSIQGVLAKPR